jgi:TolB protein
MRPILTCVAVLAVSVIVASSVAAASPGTGPSSGAAAPGTLEGQLVFEDYPNAAERSQIWIEAADGSNAHALVTSTFYDDSPTLSPDGRTVVFHRADPTASLEAVLADPTLGDKTMIVDVDGSDLREVATTSAGSGCFDAVEGDAWSPDGQDIAVTRICFDAGGAVTSFGLWDAKVDGSGQHQVTEDGPPSAHIEDHRAGWSPDGTHLAFTRIDTSVTPERSAIFIVGIDGTDLRQVTPWALDANDPVWSPDGTVIAFNSPAEANQGGEQNIFTIRPDGSGLAQLTAHLSTYPDGSQGTFHPSWSPDGTHILFTHNPSTGDVGDLFVMSRDGSDIRAVADTPIAENHADWGRSPSP